MNQQADILRSSFKIDVTPNRDEMVEKYSTIATSVPIYIEPAGSDTVYHEQFGAMGINTYIAYVMKGTSIMVQDLLLVDTTYYEVTGVLDYGTHNFPMRLVIRVKNYQKVA